MDITMATILPSIPNFLLLFLMVVLALNVGKFVFGRFYIPGFSELVAAA